MTTELLPRPVALLKLLALEPIPRDNLRLITGWPQSEIDAMVADLHKSGRLTWRNHQNRMCLTVGESERRARARRRGARSC